MTLHAAPTGQKRANPHHQKPRPASSIVTLRVQQVGNDGRITGSGSANTTALNPAGIDNKFTNVLTATALGFSPIAPNPYDLPATVQRHQLLITGNAGDTFTALDGTWTNAGTITGTGAFSGTFNVWNSLAGLSQLIIGANASAILPGSP